MPFRVLVSVLAVLLLAAPLPILTGCSDDDDCPSCPETPAALAPTMANVWPNADGNTWIHDLQVRGFDGDPADVVDPDDPDPELPGMSELHARLVVPVGSDPRDQSQGLYRVSFDGEVTTLSGVTAQSLREELFEPTGFKTRIPSHQERLRALVLAARGDLAHGRPDKDIGDQLDPPILMGGYAFEATAAGLYGYGDINTEHSWIYLEGDLTVGSEFSIQLVPDLADDVFLYGRIWSVGDLDVGGTVFADCVECFYVIDLGIGTLTDEQGIELAKIRSYIYGSVFYAPGVGPVRCHQRGNLLYGPAWDQPEAVILEIESDISGWDAALD